MMTLLQLNVMSYKEDRLVPRGNFNKNKNSDIDDIDNSNDNDESNDADGNNLWLYNDQDYRVLLISDHEFVLFNVEKGFMCQEMIDLIEDHLDLDEQNEPDEHALKCKSVVQQYNTSIIGVGFYNDFTAPIPTYLDHDYDVVTNVNLTEVVDRHVDVYIDCVISMNSDTESENNSENNYTI